MCQQLVIMAALEHHLAVPTDDGEQVIEIMRDAAGKVADGLHLLRLPQLVFELLLLGDVLCDHQLSAVA